MYPVYKEEGFYLGPDSVVSVNCCGKNRKIKDCYVYVFHDGFYFYCGLNKGCKEHGQKKN